MMATVESETLEMVSFVVLKVESLSAKFFSDCPILFTKWALNTAEYPTKPLNTTVDNRMMWNRSEIIGLNLG